MKKNIVLIDSSETEGADFIKGLNSFSGKDWTLIVEKSNDRRTRYLEYYRYYKYFTVPLRIFLKRNKFESIVTWQQFYGLMFAFYCRLFHVDKRNKLVVMSFIYKKKSGVLGLIYDKFMNYVVKSNYVDFFTSVASVQCEKFSREFNIESSKFQFIPWGITDLFPLYAKLVGENVEPYFFCAGRSNRDWNIVFNSFGGTEIPCRFIFSDTNYNDKFNNIEVVSNVSDEDYFKLLVNAYCVVVSIEDCKLAGGEITIINAMQFGKPVILIQDEKTNDYVIEGVTGFVVQKNVNEVITIALKLLKDDKLRNQMSSNCRVNYESRFSIHSVGENIGKLMSNL